MSGRTWLGNRAALAAFTTLGLAAMLTFASAGVAVAAGAPVPPTPTSGPVAGNTHVSGAIPPPGFKQVTGSTTTTWALTNDGVIYVWGSSLGDLYGMGATDPASTWPPTIITQLADGSPVPKFVQITPTKAICTNGNIWSWADWVFDPNVGDYVLSDPYPTKLTSGVDSSGATVTLPTFKQVTEVGAATIALDVNGRVWTWGSDFNGQLGNGDALTDDVLLPTQLPAFGGTIVQITADTLADEVFALDSAGNIWRWGAAQVSGPSSPTKMVTGSLVATLPSFAYVGGGYGMGFAIDTAGSLWTWCSDGGNDCIIGDGSSAPDYEPVQLSVMDSSGQPVKFKAATGNLNGGFALDTTGRVWSWGLLEAGGLGNGSKLMGEHQLTPGVLTTDTNGATLPVFTSLGYTTGDALNAFALTADGTIWKWGWDNNGYAWYVPELGLEGYWYYPDVLLHLDKIVTKVTFGGIEGTNLVANLDGTYSVDTPPGACGPVDVVVYYDLKTTYGSTTYDTGGEANGVSHDTLTAAQTPLTYPKGFTYTGAICNPTPTPTPTPTPSPRVPNTPTPPPPVHIRTDTGGSLVSTPWLAIVGAGLIVTAGLVLGVRRMSVAAQAGRHS